MFHFLRSLHPWIKFGDAAFWVFNFTHHCLDGKQWRDVKKKTHCENVSLLGQMDQAGKGSCSVSHRLMGGGGTMGRRRARAGWGRINKRSSRRSHQGALQFWRALICRGFPLPPQAQYPPFTAPSLLQSQSPSFSSHSPLQVRPSFSSAPSIPAYFSVIVAGSVTQNCTRNLVEVLSPLRQNSNSKTLVLYLYFISIYTAVLNMFWIN